MLNEELITTEFKSLCFVTLRLCFITIIRFFPRIPGPSSATWNDPSTLLLQSCVEALLKLLFTASCKNIYIFSFPFSTSCLISYFAKCIARLRGNVMHCVTSQRDWLLGMCLSTRMFNTDGQTLPKQTLHTAGPLTPSDGVSIFSFCWCKRTRTSFNFRWLTFSTLRPDASQQNTVKTDWQATS